MIYLDNAATSWPKPPAVCVATVRAFSQYGANPGRGGHDMSIQTAERIFRCRETVSRMFGEEDPSNVVFTSGCTASLNTVIHDLATLGGHVIISDLEHNAVRRPVFAYAAKGDLSFDIAPVYPGDAERTVHAFETRIKPYTRAIICTQASNVFGVAPPIREIGDMAHRHGIQMVVDGAQGAGILPIDLHRDPIDYYAAPGHKGLYGPMGTGFLICHGERKPAPLMFGGTGTYSADPDQPDLLPEALESGTLNVPGICGLCAGIEWLLTVGVENVARYERQLLQSLYDALSACSDVRLYTTREQLTDGAPVLSFNFADRHSEEGAALLNQHHIACRAGLHCAPLAHQKYQTMETGTIRLSPSCHTTAKEIETVEKVIKKYAKR